jgi:hypothetical protein
MPNMQFCALDLLSTLDAVRTLRTPRQQQSKIVTYAFGLEWAPASQASHVGRHFRIICARGSNCCGLSHSGPRCLLNLTVIPHSKIFECGSHPVVTFLRGMHCWNLVLKRSEEAAVTHPERTVLLLSWLLSLESAIRAASQAVLHQVLLSTKNMRVEGVTLRQHVAAHPAWTGPSPCVCLDRRCANP